MAKKTDKKSNPQTTSTKKGVEATPKDTQMRNAFIRVSRINMTGEDKNAPEEYTKDKVKEILDLAKKLMP